MADKGTSACYSHVSSRAEACVHHVVHCYSGASIDRRIDSIVQECEVRIIVDGVLWKTLTCSPWDIGELAAGALYLDGVIASRDELLSVYSDIENGLVEVLLACNGSPRLEGHVVSFDEALEWRNRREVTKARFGIAKGVSRSASSACAGKAFYVSSNEIHERIASFEKGSHLFHRTGGVHSAILVDSGGVLARFEDIGRHSAMDKLVGWCVLSDVDVSQATVLFSGRVPCEIITKVIKLGCPVIVSPGAPTSLSVELAQKHGVTLVGFAKGGRFNVYSHAERVVGSDCCAMVQNGVFLR